MKYYEEPQILITKLAVEDIITTSPEIDEGEPGKTSSPSADLNRTLVF